MADAASSTARSELQVVAETALDALLLVDEERCWLQANGAACELFGVRCADIANHKIDDFVPVARHRLLRRRWALAQADGRPHGRAEIVRPDGTHRRIEYRVAYNFRPGQHLIAAHELAARQLAGSFDHAVPPRAGFSISPRERDVLQLAADGRTTRQIAEALVVSPGTVRTHFEHIYQKLEVHGRSAAVATAIREGLIE